MEDETSPGHHPGKKDQGDPSKTDCSDNINSTQDIHARAFIDMANRDLITLRESRASPPDKIQLIESAVNLIRDYRYGFLYLIERSFTINSGEAATRETTLIERSLNYMRNRSNRSLVSLFIKNRVLTVLEINKTLGLDESNISYKLKTLKQIGFIEKKGRVGSPYRARTDRGAGIPLWGILEANPQDYVNAQRRYGRHVLGYDPDEEEQRRQEQVKMDAIEARAQAAQIQKYVDAVATDLEPCHAEPTRENRQIIETHMKEAGVPEEIWVQVREGAQNACRRPKGERGL